MLAGGFLPSPGKSENDKSDPLCPLLPLSKASIPPDQIQAVATVSFQNQGYKPLPWEQRQRETSVNQETSGGRLPSLSLVELPVLYIQLFSWLHSFGSASPVSCHQESHQKPSTPISFLVLEWAGPWHSLPNPDLLGSPPPWCLQHVSLLQAPESRSKLLTWAPQGSRWGHFPSTLQTS